MILRRLTENLRAQNWTAISIEFLIVVIGVFIGTQVANWNQERIDKRETSRLIVELRPFLQTRLEFFDTAKDYYATTRAYSERAFAGWRGDPAVSDEEFVTAAYQAGQIYVFNLSGENWAAIFGSDRLRQIDDVEIRRGLTRIMIADYDQIGLASVATPYREGVRRVVPEDIQDAIRAQCGDRPIPDRRLALYLPRTCTLDLPEARFAAAAAALRARPDLVGELRWHRAATANFLVNADSIGRNTRALQRAIDKSVG